MLGTVAPGVTVEQGASGGTNNLRSSVPNPAIELTGCTTGHEGVVRLVSRLRLMHGVAARVARRLGEGGRRSNAGSGTATDGDCRHGHENFPQFDVVVFFAPLPAATAPAYRPAPRRRHAAPSSSTGGGVQ